ncbi:hypothetical protein [Filimonas effusa]|uniref:Uncharacterized protein n=1 Tax=Filimonas effusa TaxID=2508721 RepID=A0A4Q1D5Z7_9BACT|nr:hypothetical protein [Filimonas effusa]RXK83879.1 hypothetical protein ESB13_17570 [Filimonas effusa]
MLLLFLLFLSLGSLVAQTGFPHGPTTSRDYIIFKKRYKTIRNYFAGSYINFRLNTGQWVEGSVVQIARDSMWMKDQRIQLIGTGFGSKIDTVTFGYRRLALSEIDAMPKEGESWGFIKNGLLFKIAGAAYIGLNVVNGLGKNADPLFGSENLPKLLTAAGVYAFGTVLGWAYKPEFRIGKKYRIQYVAM